MISVFEYYLDALKVEDDDKFVIFTLGNSKFCSITSDAWPGFPQTSEMESFVLIVIG